MAIERMKPTVERRLSYSEDVAGQLATSRTNAFYEIWKQSATVFNPSVTTQLELVARALKRASAPKDAAAAFGAFIERCKPQFAGV